MPLRVATTWRGFATLTALGVVSLGQAAVAQPTDATYERRRVAHVLQKRGYELDPAPAGKTIAFIELAREDVFIESDRLQVPVVLPAFAPTWPNSLHWLTRPQVIRRELLVSEGEPYDAARVEESMRNLRALSIFALVRIVAVRGPEDDSVGLIVYTRDLWSLRLETAFDATASASSDAFSLNGQLTERNLFGRQKQVSLSFGLDPKTFSLGEGYGDRRLFGGRLSLEQALAVIWNRASGSTEGSLGTLDFGRPFYQLADEWSWTASAAYSVYVARVLQGSEISSVRVDEEDGRLVRCEVQTLECLRQVWDRRSYSFSLSGSYRRGEAYKQTFTVGAGFSDADVEANDETELLPGQREEFRTRVLPRVRKQIFPFVRYGLFTPRYATLENLATFGQSEVVLEGPSLSFYAGLPLRAFGSSSDSLSVSGSYGYVLAGNDALAQLSATGAARLENGAVVDQSLELLLRGATPPWLLGRIALSASLEAQRRDTSNTTVWLGADAGLRGYPAAAFAVIGGSLMRANLEYRSLPVELASVHLGGVLFYDTGSVYNALSEIRFHNSVGAGLRVLFPQFNRFVFRADVGVPLERAGFSVVVSYGTAQAFALTPAEEE